MLSVPNPNVPFQHVCMHCNRLHPCIQRTLLVLSFYPDLDIRSLHQIPAQQNPFSLCHLLVRVGHPSHRRNNFKKKFIRCQNIGSHKEGENWVFLWIFGLTLKGKHILQSVDRTITTWSKLHKQNERIWLIFFDQYMDVYYFQSPNFHCRFNFSIQWEKFKFQAPQVVKTQARLPELSNYEKITLWN